MARSGLIYGPTGSHKTTAVKHFSHYIARRTGKVTLLYCADGGGWSVCEPEIAAGMILPWRLDSDTMSLTEMRRASQGYWPEDPTETRPEYVNMLAIDWTKVGGIAVEGWTSMGRIIMRYLADKGIDVGGEKNRSRFEIQMTVSGTVKGEIFGSSTRGDYGFVQNMLSGLVMNWVSLPCDYVLFTALESRGEDEDRNLIYGPGIPGKKAVADSPQWVGHCIHAQDYAVRRTGPVPDPADPAQMIEGQISETVVRFHYISHPDSYTDGLFRCNSRVVPERIAELQRFYPGGYFEPTTHGYHAIASEAPEDCGFDQFLEVTDKLSQSASTNADLTAWREMLDVKLGRSKVPSQPQVKQVKTLTTNTNTTTTTNTTTQ